MRAADTGADRRLTNRFAIGVNYCSRDPTIAGEFSVLRKKGCANEQQETKSQARGAHKPSRPKAFRGKSHAADNSDQ
jgi:hypothetical protein